MKTLLLLLILTCSALAETPAEWQARYNRQADEARARRDAERARWEAEAARREMEARQRALEREFRR